MKNILLVIALIVVTTYLILGFIGIFNKAIKSLSGNKGARKVNGTGHMESVEPQKNEDLLRQIMKNREIIKEATRNTAKQRKVPTPLEGQKT